MLPRTIVITLILFISAFLPSAASTPSLPYSYFNGMFAGKDEAALRKLAAEKNADLAARYTGTVLGQKAFEAAAKDAGRDDPHAWIADTLGVVQASLKAFPPSDANWQVRREVLQLLDYPLHVESGEIWHRDVMTFYRPFIDKAVEEITNAQVNSGLRVWKLYNIGFVVKSKSHTVAFDIHPGWKDWEFLSKDQQQALVKALDVEFVSHAHGDHANTGFLQMMLTAKKTLVLPPTVLPDVEDPHIIRLSDNSSVPAAIGDVEACSYAGYQGKVPCNVYVVKLDGYIVSQNGDNERRDMYAEIGSKHNIDILLGNCWSGLNECIEGMNPAFVVTGHENELRHPVVQRVGYKFTFDNLDRLKFAPPWQQGSHRGAVLSCGEGLHWVKGKGIVRR